MDEEKSCIYEESAELAEEEAEGFVGEVVAEVDDSEVKHDEVRDGA